MDGPLIRLSDLSFSYDSARPVLRGLSLELQEGERVGIIGANGCGKTTLLHLIVGLSKPQAGRIEVFGESRVHEKDFHAVRRKVGLLFQDSDDQLFCPTVAEDVAFGPLNLGKTRDEARNIVRETLVSLDLTGYEERITHKLSGGEKRLVALATVLAMQPRVLLLDEPLTGLDEAHEERITAILQRLPQELVVVSHDRKFLEAITGRVWKIEEGRLEQF